MGRTREVSVLLREVAWAAVGAAAGVLWVRLFVIRDPDDYCGGDICALIYITPTPWFAWPIAALTGAASALLIRRLVVWLRSPAQAG